MTINESINLNFETFVAGLRLKIKFQMASK